MDWILPLLTLIGIVLVGLSLLSVILFCLFITIGNNFFAGFGDRPGHLFPSLHNLGLYMRTRFKRY